MISSPFDLMIRSHRCRSNPLLKPVLNAPRHSFEASNCHSATMRANTNAGSRHCKISHRRLAGRAKRGMVVTVMVASRCWANRRLRTACIERGSASTKRLITPLSANGVCLRSAPPPCVSTASPLPDTGRPQCAWAAFPRQVVEKSWPHRIATQRRTQATLNIDLIDVFPPKHSLRNGFTAYT
jgi:hypothetical protein